MSKRGNLIEKQQEEQRKLRHQILEGEDALSEYHEKFTLIEDTGYTMAKEMGVLEDENVQLGFQRVHQEYEENVRIVNLKLENLNQDLEKMKAKHEKELKV